MTVCEKVTFAKVICTFVNMISIIQKVTFTFDAVGLYPFDKYDCYVWKNTCYFIKSEFQLLKEYQK